MDSITLGKSELLALLDLKGAREVVGLERSHLPMPEPFEIPITLEDGRSRLLEQNYLSVEEDHYVIDARLDVMTKTLTDPQTVLRTWRSTAGDDEDLWCWYFVSAADLIQLATSGPEQYELSRLADIDAMLAQIAEILHLEPVADAVNYRATMDQDDVDVIRALADDRDEVPALTIMEADGLAPVEAIEFFGDLTEPKWRGRVDFMSCSSGQADTYHRLLVLQGQELSWLAWQDDPNKSDLFIQTATGGAFEDHLLDYLLDVSP